MKNLFLILVLVFSLNTLKAQNTPQKSCSKTCSRTCAGKSQAYHRNVSPSDFMAYANRFPAEQIVDIRTPKEVKANGMLKDAININYNNEKKFKAEMNKLEKDAAVMIYCASGRRSGEAIALLKSWGFKKIYNMEGGYNEYLKVFGDKENK